MDPLPSFDCDLRLALHQVRCALDIAAMADHVFQDQPKVPSGWRVLEESELFARTGLTWSAIDLPTKTPFARIYVPTTQGWEKPTAIMVFQAAKTEENWLDTQTYLRGGSSRYYDHAASLGVYLGRMDMDLLMGGHSMGGGLACAAAKAGGFPAVVLASAGLQAETVFCPPQPSAPILHYTTCGDYLLYLQGIPSWLKASLKCTVQTFGGEVGPSKSFLPGVPGEECLLSVVKPSEKSWLDLSDWREGHRLQWIRAALVQQEGKLMAQLGKVAPLLR